jgi:hypothetical protein
LNTPAFGCDYVVRPTPGDMSQPESIPLQEAIHELRRLRDTNLRAAITEMNDLLATGEVQAVGLVDGKRTEINALWWWASSNFEYPNNSVMFSFHADGEPRPTRATEMTLSFDAWERQKARIAASKRHRRPISTRTRRRLVRQPACASGAS